MHVVVTGAAGFIGSHVCERLVALGHRVTGLDSFDGYLYPAERKRGTAAAISGLPNFLLVEGNICDPAVVERVIDESVDVVCHLAALAGVRPSLAEPVRYARTNIEGTAIIVERMRRIGCARLVFASSSSVYGARPADSDSFVETDPCLRPASPYAATKRMNELQLSAYRDLFGLGVIALRFFTVYGPRQRPDMAIASFTDAIANRRPITLFGDGSSARDYTFIDDIVAGVTAAIERVVPGQFDIVNLGGTRVTALRELVSLIEQAVGIPAEIQWAPMQPGDVPITRANIERARTLLDYAPVTSPAEGIARYWSWSLRR